MAAIHATLTRLVVAIQVAGVVLLTQGCIGFTHESTSTSPTSIAQSFVGEWRSANSAFPTSQSCTDLVWNVSSQTESSVAGTFEATCAGGITLTGTATGELDGDLHINAYGTASGFGATACNFTLTGTGVLQADGSIRVDYTGQTCIGPISGTEIIRR
jgi:hypothetical protein